MIDKVKRFFALLGVFGDQVNIQGLNYSSVRKSKVLQEFYLNPNNEIEMFKLIKGFGYQSFLDFGAYFGYFSLYAIKIAKIQNVIAYEADPDNFSQIVKFAKKNLVELEAINKAVGDVVGEIEFFKPVYKGTTKFPSHGQIGDPNSDSNNLYRGREYRKFLVTMDSIENIVNDKVDGLSLIKLDIEGFEERCLRSIEEFLKRAEEVDLLVEIMINDSNKNEVFSFLKYSDSCLAVLTA